MQWVVDAWNALSSDVIVKSFRSCGISLKPDGSEDNELHSSKDKTGSDTEELSLSHADLDLDSDDIEALD